MSSSRGEASTARAKATRCLWPRPRRRVELANKPAYNHYRAQVLHFLYENQQI